MVVTNGCSIPVAVVESFMRDVFLGQGMVQPVTQMAIEKARAYGMASVAVRASSKQPGFDRIYTAGEKESESQFL